MGEGEDVETCVRLEVMQCGLTLISLERRMQGERGGGGGGGLCLMLSLTALEMLMDHFLCTIGNYREIELSTSGF